MRRSANQPFKSAAPVSQSAAQINRPPVTQSHARQSRKRPRHSPIQIGCQSAVQISRPPVMQPQARQSRNRPCQSPIQIGCAGQPVSRSNQLRRSANQPIRSAAPVSQSADQIGCAGQPISRSHRLRRKANQPFKSATPVNHSKRLRQSAIQIGYADQPFKSATPISHSGRLIGCSADADLSKAISNHN
eukprot:2507495-Karenia_brevis.AAC.1